MKKFGFESESRKIAFYSLKFSKEIICICCQILTNAYSIYTIVCTCAYTNVRADTHECAHARELWLIDSLLKAPLM